MSVRSRPKKATIASLTSGWLTMRRQSSMCRTVEPLGLEMLLPERIREAMKPRLMKFLTCSIVRPSSARLLTSTWKKTGS